LQEAAAMNVLRFHKRADIDAVVVDIFITLATARGVDITITCRRFQDEHPNLRPADLTAAFGLTHRVVSVFERHLAETGDESSDGGAA
jgi:hypothetical protein